jgi:hypothetical protein
VQVSRRVDGPNCEQVDATLVCWRIPLANGAFESIETEFQDLQRAHHDGVSSFVKREDCNEIDQRYVFWEDREKFDCQVQRLAEAFQAEVLREWRFLLIPWARDAAIRSSVSADFRLWSLSERAIVEFDAHLQKASSYRWMMSLLYAAAQEMQEGEVSSVLSSLMSSMSLSASEFDRLAKSLKAHRATSLSNRSRSYAQFPLMLFVDSEVAQFPLESCPCLRALEVVRGVAPNATLEAFQQHRCRSEVSCASAAACRGTDSINTSASTPNGLPTTLIRKSQRSGTNPLLPAESRNEPHDGRVEPHGGFFVLDPSKDATCAQTYLQQLLASWRKSGEHGTWTGHVGQPFPDTSALLNRLRSEDVFLYMGHGQSARRLLKAEALQMGAPIALAGDRSSTAGPRCAPLQAVVMLMGCSTAKISRLPPVANPTASIDGAARSCCRTKTYAGGAFEAFGMPLNALIGGSPAVVGALWDVLGGDLEQFVCALLKDWVSGTRSSKRLSANGRLMSALVKARKACKLRFLTGAAVVCYGIPM